MNIRRSLVLYLLFPCVITLVQFRADDIIAQKALVVVPVADLLGTPLIKNNDALSYDNIPLAAGKFMRNQLCPRLHQVIFNEIVDIIGEQSSQVRINIPNIYYLSYSDRSTHTTYWTLRHNLIPLDTLKKKGLDLNNIPEPIAFSNNGLAMYNENTITLVLPWLERQSNRTFSAGTRFALTHKQNYKDFYSVYVFDPISTTFTTQNIPKELATKCNTSTSTHERRVQFVNLLRRWAHQEQGAIPYVWGGCSFITTCMPTSFEKRERPNKESATYYYTRKDVPTNPHVGFDCSGIIARAAQACGIPYFFKNTTTLAQKLRPLTCADAIAEGDLFWHPGHVMIIANLKKNTLIESRGYSGGYGIVHEIQISKLFLNIRTYDELVKAYFAKKPLTLLNNKGNRCSILTDYKILKLASIWNNTPIATP